MSYATSSTFSPSRTWGISRGAAEQSFVAQSALSQQVSRLEKELGARLFVRTSHMVELTPGQRASSPRSPHRRRCRPRTGGHAVTSRIGERTSLPWHDPDFRQSDRYRSPDQPLPRCPSGDRDLGRQPALQRDGRQRRARGAHVAVVGASPDELPDRLEARLIATDPLVAVIDAEVSRKLVGPLTLKQALKFGPLINFAPGTGIRRHVDDALKRAGIESRLPYSRSRR